jgi:hypothetical protein
LSRNNFSNLMARLLKKHSFCLQKISPTTFASDVITTHRKRGEAMSQEEIDGIVKLVKTGTAFRCRIGKGRFCYGGTVTDALAAALGDK